MIGGKGCIAFNLAGLGEEIEELEEETLSTETRTTSSCQSDKLTSDKLDYQKENAQPDVDCAELEGEDNELEEASDENVTTSTLPPRTPFTATAEIIAEHRAISESNSNRERRREIARHYHKRRTILCLVTILLIFIIVVAMFTLCSKVTAESSKCIKMILSFTFFGLLMFLIGQIGLCCSEKRQLSILENSNRQNNSQ
ncbi:hypothetical protein [Candidatus Ichthyocystis hellenicum]|uniref:hypothetical protein n=1 Tax=Candidatus Ichthyocystis hellenicum TaxID=1561003 RepID=UPI000B895121|nr:hypothetical protein [Candidatus Ichthyocystis hellenicum]